MSGSILTHTKLRYHYQLIAELIIKKYNDGRQLKQDHSYPGNDRVV